MKSIYFIFLFQCALCFNLVAQITLKAGSQTASPGSTISVPISINSSEAIDVLAFQLVLDWDATLLEYQSIESFGVNNMDMENFGTPDLTLQSTKLSAIWEDYPNTIPVSTETTIFTVNFLVKENFKVGMSTEVGFCTDCITEFYNQNISSLNVNYQSGEISVASLPLEWIKLEARLDKDGIVLLQWITLNENNTSHFKVEHSIDAENWETIGRVAAAGTTTEKQNYYFAHQKPVVGANFYRLQQVDINGDFTYSDIRQIKNDKPNSVLTWNNPVKDKLFMQYVAPEQGQITLDLFNSEGKLIKQQVFEVQHGDNNITWEVSDLPSGIYWINSNDIIDTTLKMIKL